MFLLSVRHHPRSPLVAPCKPSAGFEDEAAPDSRPTTRKLRLHPNPSDYFCFGSHRCGYQTTLSQQRQDKMTQTIWSPHCTDMESEWAVARSGRFMAACVHQSPQDVKPEPRSSSCKPLGLHMSCCSDRRSPPPGGVPSSYIKGRSHSQACHASERRVHATAAQQAAGAAASWEGGELPIGLPARPFSHHHLLVKYGGPWPSARPTSAAATHMLHPATCPGVCTTHRLGPSSHPPHPLLLLQACKH